MIKSEIAFAFKAQDSQCHHKSGQRCPLSISKKQHIYPKTLNVERYVTPTKAQALALLGVSNPAFKADSVDRFKQSMSAEQKRQRNRF
ncbi:hypothetical protein LU604_19865 [Erwinia tracheiphila]|uniref:hypothetical protein n=1 Tax=Erwinia tracheiphila TaxID=65700 RepID=UPI001F16A0A8|nr:hypothetical protein [Erwinia tracheiphila]UIA82710.1 hypothetical protein LU604_19865 [Erwinia tracheiphila]UIA91293.1 hypothetical protein LU632_19375 [Erwinia tracheiphila]